MDYLLDLDKILITNYGQIIIADPYTLKSVSTTSNSLTYHSIIIPKTIFALITLKYSQIQIFEPSKGNIVEIADLTQYIGNAQQHVSQVYKFNCQTELIILSSNQDGIISLSLDMVNYTIQYLGKIYLSENKVKDYYRRFTKHSTEDIIFMGGDNLEIIAIKVLSFANNSYKEMKITNDVFKNSKQELITNIIFSKIQNSLIVGDKNNIYHLDLQIDFENGNITFPVDSKQKELKNAYEWYIIQESFPLIVVSQQSSFTVYDQQNQLYTQFFSKLNTLIKISIPQPDLILLLKEKSITTGQYNFKWEQLNDHLDPFEFKDTIWVTVAFPNKANLIQNVGALFYLINAKDTNIFHPLVNPNSEINKRNTSFVMVYLEDINSPEIIGVDNIGTIHVWNLLSNTFDHKYSIEIEKCQNVKIGDIFVNLSKKKFITVCENTSYAIDFTTKQKEYLMKLTISSFAIKAYSELSIVAISDYILGQVYFFKYDSESDKFNQFFKIQPGLLQDTILSIELLKDNVLWIQYSSSMLFYKIKECLQNDKLCKQCTYSSYFDATKVSDDKGLYGKGLQTNPFTTSANFITSIIKSRISINFRNAFMFTHKCLLGMYLNCQSLLFYEFVCWGCESQYYKEIIGGVSNIIVDIFISPNNQLDLYSRLVTFDFASIITLAFKTSLDNNPARITFNNQFKLQNFNAIIFSNIIIQFGFDLPNQECGLSFINIQTYAEINNIQLITSIPSQINCQKIYVDKTYLKILKYTISNQTFLSDKYIISTINSDQVNYIQLHIKQFLLFFKIYISNFTLENCVLGETFSILYQETNVEATIENLNLTKNQCIEHSGIIWQSTSLFTAGLYIVNGVILKENTFCDKSIFSTTPSVKHTNQTFKINNVEVIDNKFSTQTNYILFNALYPQISTPSHEITLNNIKLQNNVLLLDNPQQLYVSSFIQTYNIAKLTLNDIILENHNEIQFGQIEFSLEVTLNNFQCSNKEIIELNQSLISPSCIYFNEPSMVNIKNIIIQNKVGQDNSLIIFKSLNQANMKIELTDGEFKNLSLKQFIMNSYANPIYVESSFQTSLTINNCHFKNNNLFIENLPLTRSTTGLYVQNILGSVSINKSTFINSSSQNKYGFIFIQTYNLQLLDVKLKQSSYFISDKTNALNQFYQEGGFMNVVVTSLTIKDTEFSQSIAKRGSFLLIKFFKDSFTILIQNTKFSEGYCLFDGGAILIDTLGEDSSFTCDKCIFENIYMLFNKAAVIRYEKYDAILQPTNQVFIFGGSIKNIFGLHTSYFIDIIYSNMVIEDISEIKSEEFQSNSKMHKEFQSLGINKQATFLNSIDSIVEINKCNFSYLKTNLATIEPLLINSQNSEITLNDIQVFECSFINNLIVINHGTLTIKNSKFINVQNYFVENYRILQDSFFIKQFSSLIEVTDSQVIVKQSQFSKIKCQNNSYGGVLRILDGTVNLEQLEISDIQGYNEGVIYFYGINGDSNIKNVQFINCSSVQNGGALSLNSKSIDKFKFIIEDCKFQNNLSSNGRGGAVFIKSEVQYSNEQSFIIKNSQFNKNEAIIGGAIYQRDIYLSISDDTKFIDNKGKIFGNDQISYPTKLFLANQEQILSKNHAKLIGDQIEIFDFRSGDTLQTMSFQFRNDQDVIFKPNSDDELQKQNVFVRISSNNENTKNYNIRGSLISFYNKETQFYSFNDLIIVGTPSTSVLIEFKSDQIYNLNKDTSKYEQKYSFNLKINFRNCINGEQIKEYNDLIECDVCKPGLYSYDQKQCQDCPSGATCNGGVDVVTNHGFWRKTSESVLIENCNNLQENCIGGSFGDHICYEGHIGALCEECDIYGIQWGNSYSKSGKYQCTRCDKIKNNMWMVFLMTLWAQISMTLAIKGDIEVLREKAAGLTIKKNIKKKSLIKANTPSIYKNTCNNIQERRLNLIKSNSTLIVDDEDQVDKFEDKSGIYIKLFTNYIQIVSSIASFNLNIPSGIFEFPSSVGQPLKSTMNSLDCVLEQLDSDIPIIFIRLIFSMIIPLIYMLLFLIGILFYHLITKQQKIPWYMISTAAMFLIIYVQPDLVAQTIALISCRKIGDTFYILSNVSYECYTDEHKMYIGYLMVPFLLLWVLILPIFLYLMLKKNQKKLNTIKIKLKYGFLYKEYKNRAFYWEFVKMATKITMILCLNFYSQSIVIKGVLVFIVIVAYGILAMIVEPYKEQDVNQMDKNSTYVCALTVQLGLFIYNNEFDYLVYLSISIIVIINVWFIIKILKRIIKGFTLKVSTAIQPLLTKLSKKIPFFEKCLDKKESKKKINPIIKEKIKKVFLKYINMSNTEKRKFILKTIESQLALTHGNIFRMYDGNSESQNSEQIKLNEKKSEQDTIDSQIQEHEKNDVSIKLNEHETKRKKQNTFDIIEQNYDTCFNLQTPPCMVPVINTDLQIDDQQLNLIPLQESEEK